MVTRLTVRGDLFRQHVPPFLHFGPNRGALQRLSAQDVSRVASARVEHRALDAQQVPDVIVVPPGGLTQAVLNQTCSAWSEILPFHRFSIFVQNVTGGQTRVVVYGATAFAPGHSTRRDPDAGYPERPVFRQFPRFPLGLCRRLLLTGLFPPLAQVAASVSLPSFSSA